MKIYRPLWSDGAFLAPQEFQQQARWDAHVADSVSRTVLVLFRLYATWLSVRFADVTLVDTDLAGHERTELAVLRYALTLRLSSQENKTWPTCPVARLSRSALGQWIVDQGFILPRLSLSAIPTLVSKQGDLLHCLAARRKRLMAMRRESNERMAVFAVARAETLDIPIAGTNVPRHKRTAGGDNTRSAFFC